MVLILNNKDLESVLDMPSCVEALYRGLKAFSRGDAVRRPRIDLFAPTSRAEEFACFSSMDGVIRDGYYAIRIKPDIRSWPVIAGFKRDISYCTRPGLFGGLVLLFRTDNAEPLAIMNDGFIQHMRVGATAALGARYLSRSDASVVGILGSGGMARTFAAGFTAVRKITKIKAYSPNQQHLDAYCREMSEKLELDVIPQGSAEETVRGSEIVATCTDSRDPVVKGEWLEPGMFVANVRSIELDEEAFRRISLVGYLIFDQDPLKLEGFSDRDFDLRFEVLAYLAGSPEERKKIPQEKLRVAALTNAGGCRAWTGKWERPSAGSLMTISLFSPSWREVIFPTVSPAAEYRVSSSPRWVARLTSSPRPRAWGSSSIPVCSFRTSALKGHRFSCGG